MSSTVDTEEVKKFSQTSADAWSESGEFRTLHHLNPTRFAFIERHVALQGKSLLDIGCGGGILATRLAQAGAQVTGIDLSTTALDYARLQAEQNALPIEYRLEALEDHTPTHSTYYDVITCMELLEHVADPETLIQYAAQALKPGGWIFFSTINRHPFAYVKAILGAEYVLRLLPKGTHDYAKFLKPSELAACCRQAGLQVRSICGVEYDPFREVAQECESLNVQYMMACQR